MADPIRTVCRIACPYFAWSILSMTTSDPNLALPLAIEQKSLPGTFGFPIALNSFLSPLIPARSAIQNLSFS